jgi:hypothetical protein
MIGPGVWQLPKKLTRHLEQKYHAVYPANSEGNHSDSPCHSSTATPVSPLKITLYRRKTGGYNFFFGSENLFRIREACLLKA